MGQQIRREGVVELFEMYDEEVWGKKKICDISSLDLVTLDSKGEEAVSVITGTIAATCCDVITTRETGV